MEQEQLKQVKEYYQKMEEGMADLSEEERAKVFRPCAIDCVKKFVLGEQKRQFTECHGDLDLQYEKYGHSEYFFAEIIEKGHVYEIGYPRCFCYMVDAGFAKDSIHCECSRQSILYVFQQLMPDKKVDVTTIETVLSGGKECRFRVEVE